MKYIIVSLNVAFKDDIKPQRLHFILNIYENSAKEKNFMIGVNFFFTLETDKMQAHTSIRNVTKETQKRKMIRSLNFYVFCVIVKLITI